MMIDTSKICMYRMLYKYLKCTIYISLKVCVINRIVFYKEENLYFLVELKETFIKFDIILK